MRLYAETAWRAARQVAADLAALAFLLLAVWVATAVRDAVLLLRGPGEDLAAAGDAIGGAFTSAADSARGVPLVGDDLAGALGRGTRAGADLAEAGRTQTAAVDALGFWLPFALIAVPALALALTWLPRRVRFARDATAAARLRAQGRAGLELLAARALVNQPLPRLARLRTTDWTDPGTVATLADWELRRLGLRASRRP
ncbi:MULTISPECIES: hypothetical protein [Actinokineospora]|uniref:Transmembrane protein n=1 Tax=Actinokineospora fastidiosa TaxID=1816 RepID=A0A918GPI2_9PSEU|nr:MULTISPECIES: hypothetical protein [Actinokineospora]UVS78132.1 hypothetical protein Actkin_01856 [Actinokineospora sp. UTMC 2448]GGS49442.1 hypothetical protein GCM10010171_50710 [Actinokineospora fastidiosa]